jgi:hypothetical protein
MTTPTISWWNPDEEDYEQIEITQAQVVLLRTAADQFEDVINRYIRERASVDPQFKNVPEFELGGSEDVSFDLLGDEVTVEWKQYGRCGDSEHFRRSFPFSDLWSGDWQARIEDEARRKAQEQAEQKAAAELAQAKAVEDRERALLHKLQAKYANGGAG